MNRNAIKKFATWARTHLREQITAKAARYGITAKGSKTPQYVSGGMTIAGFTYDGPTTDLYGQLIGDLNDKRRRGLSDKAVLDALIDEMTYTWFNRLTALRFMEVHGYALHALSSSTAGLVDPDLLQQASALVSGEEFRGVTLDDLDRWRRGGEEEVYRNLLVAHCRNLAEPLPFLFGEGKRYAVLFLPDNLLTTGSVLRRLVQDIPQEDWQDIEIIGWLYQFYISERKDEVFEKGGAYEPRDIPAATQLFTPHWIVRYMVENSLGRLWLEAHPESTLREQMRYYLETEGGEKPAPNPALRPEDLTVLDPACGSGHILVYAFDLLMAIYTEQGYPEREIPALILEHNLHGLDIDERAAQLASFALMMKARERSRRILRTPPALHVTHTVPTRGWVLPDMPDLKKDDWQPLLDAFIDADNLGSLITPPEMNVAALEGQLMAFEASGRQEVSVDAPRLWQLLKQRQLLHQGYQAVVANPPYMGGKAFNKTVKDFVNLQYPRSKSDLFAVFMERIAEMTDTQGYAGMVTMQSWMFLSSYEALREQLLTNHTLVSLVHMDNMVMRIAFGTSAFVVAKRYKPNLQGAYTWIELNDLDETGESPKIFPAVNQRNSKAKNNIFSSFAKDFKKIPGSSIAYWANPKVLNKFEMGKPVDALATIRQGMKTADNARFVRYWFEPPLMRTAFKVKARVEAEKSGKKWFPYIDGGSYRNWFGNHDVLVNWENDGDEVKKHVTKRNNGGHWSRYVVSLDYFFQPGVTWSAVSSGRLSARVFDSGHIFSSVGICLFADRGTSTHAFASLLNSVVGQEYLGFLSPTLYYATGEIGKIPFVLPKSLSAVDKTVESAVSLSKTDWDNFETSWDFLTHPLLRTSHTHLENAFNEWRGTTQNAFSELRRLEEENNSYWIEAYGLEDELTSNVPDEQITIRRADLMRDIKSLFSYAVGCMVGRYSLAAPGLQFAGGTFDPSSFGGDFVPETDGILPIIDEAYFEDDIVARFAAFMRTAFGAEHLEENLTFVADALSRKGGESAVARIRRYFVSEFVSDHIRTYKKRPIYWLLTSGKGKAFGALFYIHRYTPDTLASVRNDYVLPLQSKLEAEIRSTERAVTAATSASAAKAESKRLARVREQVAELLAFHDRLLHKADQRIDIDLDDGVAYNYTLFGDLLYTGADIKLTDLMKKSQWKRDLLAVAETSIVGAD